MSGGFNMGMKEAVEFLLQDMHGDDTLGCGEHARQCGLKIPKPKKLTDPLAGIVVHEELYSGKRITIRKYEDNFRWTYNDAHRMKVSKTTYVIKELAILSAQRSIDQEI